MIVALRGSYVEYVLFTGVTEKYPLWFQQEIYYSIYTDENRYTFYVPREERSPDYYEKTLVEDYSVFVRKPNGDVHVTDYDTFNQIYISFKFDKFTNSGIAAEERDCIEYVECQAGVLPKGYPDWFYEYFTEAVNLPQDEMTFLFYNVDKRKIRIDSPLLETESSGICIDRHCVFLLNKAGEIKGMEYDIFLEYYDPEPQEEFK